LSMPYPPHMLQVRGDGTLAAFFSTDDISALAAAAGLEVAACRYVYRRVRNRKKGVDMRRVFVQAQLRKPDPLVDAYVLVAGALGHRGVG
jgi:hypothetical protein